MRAVLSTLLVLSLVAGARAQAPAAPELTEAQRLQLRLIETQVENAQLRLTLAQAQLDAVSREGAAYITSLAREGFTLTRGERGWTYVPNGASQ